MGRLTTDFTRMVDEIRSGHASRGHATAERKRTVSRMLGEFRSAQKEMARRQRGVLREFMTQLENSVQALRSAFRADLAGAHAAWFGTTAAPPAPAREHSKRATKAA